MLLSREHGGHRDAFQRAGCEFLRSASRQPARVTVIFGTVRNAFERNLTAAEADALQRPLMVMSHTYLRVTMA